MSKDARKPPAERRRHPVGHDPRRELRRTTAAIRAAERALRSPSDHLLWLDIRPGASARERKRLETVDAA